MHIQYIGNNLGCSVLLKDKTHGWGGWPASKAPTERLVANLLYQLSCSHRLSWLIGFAEKKDGMEVMTVQCDHSFDFQNIHSRFGRNFARLKIARNLMSHNTWLHPIWLRWVMFSLSAQRRSPVTLLAFTAFMCDNCKSSQVELNGNVRL